MGAMKLSIIITCLDDPDIWNTVESIISTSGNHAEIIIVNDGVPFNYSPLPTERREAFKLVNVINNVRRCGVGPSRTIGVHHAKGEYVMIIDSHMRFKPGWYEEVMRRVESRPHTIHGVVCAGLDSKNMDVNNPKGRYYGATLELFGPDPNRGGCYRMLEGTWNKSALPDDSEIACLMGACYIMPRQWFLHLDALRFLKSWGCDEQMLSLKCWLAGGDIRLISTVEVGHVFLQGDEVPPYKTPVGHIAYNKLLLWRTVLLGYPLPPLKFDAWIAVYGGGEWSTGEKMMNADQHLFEVEIARNRSIFKHSFEWYAARHGIALNGKTK